MHPVSKMVIKLISFSGLALTLIPAVLFFKDLVGKNTYYNLMLYGTILWFSSAIFWVRRDDLG